MNNWINYVPFVNLLTLFGYSPSKKEWRIMRDVNIIALAVCLILIIWIYG